MNILLFSFNRGLLVALLLLTSALSAQEKFDFKTHPFFKHLIGEWSSEGERKYADGRVQKVKMEWKTEVEGDALIMEGTRDRDGQTNHFKWTFTHADSGLIEATYQQEVSNPNSQHYEVQAPEDGSQMTMTALLDNNAKVEMTDAFKPDDRDMIESKVTRTDASGATIYTGTSTAKRKKS